MNHALPTVLLIFVASFLSLILLGNLYRPVPTAKLYGVKSDLQFIARALETYRKTTGDYPTTDQGLMALVTRPGTLPEERDWQPIATKVPTDPWKNEYRYRRLPDSSPRPFELRCVGPDGIEGNEDDRVSE